MSEPANIVIPADLRPADGRFGSGPTKVRPEQVAALAATGQTLLGTSHRQAPVRGVVQRVRDGLAQLFALPDDYQVVLGNGGTTAFWDTAAFCLVGAKSQHLSFGEFSAKFAKVTHAAPWLAEPSVISSDPGTHPLPRAEAGVDVVRAHPQRDVHRRGHAGPPPGGRGRRRARPGRRHQRGGRDRGGRGRVRRVLLRAAEVLRRRRRAVGGAAVARGGRAGRPDHGQRPLHPGVPVPADRDRQLQAAADLQHPRRGDAVPAGRAGRVDDWPMAAWRGRRNGPPPPPGSSTTGPTSPRWRPRSSPTRRSGRRSSSRSTSPTR